MITTDNYELYFYRYAEGELDIQDRAAVEAFAAQHPRLAEELALYDPNLKLQKETMACPKKGRLLHHKASRVPLWRWAAAACVAALLVGGGLCVRNASLRSTNAAKYVAAERLSPLQCGMDETAKPTEPMGIAALVEPVESEHRRLQQTDEIEQEQVGSIASAPQNVHVAVVQPVAEVVDQSSAEVVAMVQDPEIRDCLEEISSPALANIEGDTGSSGFTVIEYNDMVVAPKVVWEEVAGGAEDARVSTRWRALRTRIGNTIRDYTHRTYVHTRGKFLALADR